MVIYRQIQGASKNYPLMHWLVQHLLMQDRIMSFLQRAARMLSSLAGLRCRAPDPAPHIFGITHYAGAFMGQEQVAGLFKIIPLLELLLALESRAQAFQRHACPRYRNR